MVESNKLNQKTFIKNLAKGAILVEFAFAVPILFVIIYYLLDLAKIKQYDSRMEFVVRQMAQILQLVSNGRPITQKHIKYAVGAAYLSFYPGTALYSTSGATGPYYGPGFAHGKIYYVVCDNGGKASVQWCMQWQLGGGTSRGTDPNSIAVSSITEDARSLIRTKLSVTPSEIYPPLSMNPGEKKIILEAFIYFAPNTGYQKVGGKSWGSVQNEFGFYIISPKPARTTEFYFDKVVMFSPRPGLFSETPPQ